MARPGFDLGLKTESNAWMKIRVSVESCLVHTVYLPGVILLMKVISIRWK